MLATSQKFKEAIESSTRQIKTRIILKGITYVNSDVFSVEYNGGSITGDTFNIGSTFSNNIKVTFSSIIEGLLLDDEIKLEFGVVLSDLTVEYVKMGTFYITSYDPQRNDFKTVIEASDKMIQLNGTYESELSYPSTIKKVAMEIANKAGILVNETSFSRLSNMPINEPSGYTYRQAIGLIAQFECGFALIDRNGLLDIRMLIDPEYAVNPDSYFSKGLTKDETNYQIGGINCKVVTQDGDSSETTTLQSGSTSGAQISIENNVMTQTLLDGMYQKLRNLNYFPFTLSWRGNPSLESGDWITVVDLKGTRLKVPNLNYKLIFSGGLKATSSANTQTISSSSYQYKGNLQQQIIELAGRIGAAGNHIYDSLEEPLKPEEKDLWFKPNGPDTEIWIYQNGEWVFQVSTAINPEITQAIEQAKTEAEDAKTSAQYAVDKANASVAAVQANTQLINDVNTIANNAKNQAQTATTNAQTALVNAQSALDKANGISTKVTTIETNINTINGTLSSKANTTDLNALTSRVTTAETSITQNSNDIKAKANQTDVNTITGKVSSLESNFTIQSGQISALNTKTDGHTTQIGSLQSSYSGLVSTVANVENSLSQNNLVYNSTLQSGSDGWTFHSGFTQSSARNINGNYIINFSLASNPSNTWYFARSKPVSIGIWKTYAYRVNLMRRTDISNSGNFAVGVEGFDANGTRVEFKTINTHSSLTDDSWVNYSDSYTFTNPDVKTVCFTLATNGYGHYIACQPILVNDSKVGNFVPDGMDKGQISQMIQDVDGFKQTVANTYLTKTDATNTYPTKTTVTSQISQSATEVRQDIQSWTNGQLANYSTIQSTSNSIALAVADKVTQSQFTVLSNQVTSTVEGLASTNLLSNSEFLTTSGWSTLGTYDYFSIGTNQYDNYNGSNTLMIVRNSNSSNAWWGVDSNRIRVYPGQKLSIGTALFLTGAAGTESGRATVNINYYKDSSSIRFSFIGLEVDVSKIRQKNYYLVENKIVPEEAQYASIYIVFNGTGKYLIGQPKFVIGEKIGIYTPAKPASQSQITQLADDINLRVTKGDVLSQINIEAGRTLIDTKLLLLSAETVKFTGSAFIPNAMIQSITADKITAGTINAANVNIINLNAANITTGTLTGANLSMNLNTGEVLFQKGAIRKTDGNFVIDITNGEISSDDSNGGFSLKSGTLILRRSSDKAQYGSINYGLNNTGESNLGITIVGNNGYMLKTQNFVSSYGGTRAVIGTGISSSKLTNFTTIKLEAENGVELSGGKTYDYKGLVRVPKLNVGNGIAYTTSIIGLAEKIMLSGQKGDNQSYLNIGSDLVEIISTETLVTGILSVMGSKNAIHATRDGVRATPAYETAESYLGDIGSNYTKENCEVWIPIDELFSDTVNTDIAYHVFLQAYDDAHFWVYEFKPDKFLVKSDKPMARFAWEIKAKRRGYENDRLVLQTEIKNKQIEDAWRESA